MESWKERPHVCTGDREMFFARLLVGNEIEMHRDSPSNKTECRAMAVPPTHPTTGLRYDTVTGKSRGSQVWIVYENGRAYPEYLVRYFRGDRSAPSLRNVGISQSLQQKSIAQVTDFWHESTGNESKTVSARQDGSLNLDLESLQSGSSNSWKSSESSH
jgi:hypothetical protein